MFTTPAFAQAAGGGGAGDIFSMILPLIMVMGVFWFLMIRPQQKRAKEHQDMVAAIRRGDNVVTSGGIIGKVTKVIDDNEVQVEISEGTRIRILRPAITEVRAKSEPVKTPSKTAAKAAAKTAAKKDSK